MPNPRGVDADGLASELVKRLLDYIANHERGTMVLLKPRKIKRILKMNVPPKVLSRVYRILEEGYGFKVVPMRGGGGRRPLYAVIIETRSPVIQGLRNGRFHVD
jgi:hypothetical protein